MPEALINSSYLILRLCEDIYARRYEARDFTLREVEAFWNAGQRGMGSEVEPYLRIAMLATRGLDPSDREHIQNQVSATIWRQVQELPTDTAWPELFEPDVEDVDLDDARKRSVEKIERGAEATRRRFITSGSGQVMAYQRKYQEAVAYLADQSAPVSQFPHLVAEIGITGEDLYQVAQVVANLCDVWAVVSARIERGRLHAKAAVAAADNLDEILDAANVDWDAALEDAGVSPE